MEQIYPIPEPLAELLALYNSDECTEEQRVELEYKMQEFCEFQDFITYLCDYAANKEADVAFWKTEYDRLKAKMDSAKLSAEKTWTFVEKLLKGRQVKKLRAGTFDLSFRKSTQTIVTDVDELNDVFVKLKKEPDKTAIKKAIQSGEDVAGAYLKEVENLQVK